MNSGIGFLLETWKLTSKIFGSYSNEISYSVFSNNLKIRKKPSRHKEDRVITSTATDKQKRQFKNRL